MNLFAPDKSRQLLEEEDGIKLLDASEMLEIVGEDLRKSLGAEASGEAQTNLREQMQLMRELEKVRAERDEYKRNKEQLQRDLLNQTFGKIPNTRNARLKVHFVYFLESNLEIKEELQILREQELIRNELLERYEKRNEDISKEVSNASHLHRETPELVC